MPSDRPLSFARNLLASGWRFFVLLILIGSPSLSQANPPQDGTALIDTEMRDQTLPIDFDISPEFASDLELVAITHWKGAARSRDAGRTWEPINGDLSPSFWTQASRLRKGAPDYAKIQQFHSIAYSPDYSLDHTLYAGLQNEFLISKDGGDSWDRIDLTQFTDGVEVIPDSIRFSSHFASDGIMFFGGRQGEGQSRAGAVFRSTDHGHSWKQVLRVEGESMQSLALSHHFSEDGIGYVSSARSDHRSEVFRTHDGGLTWKAITGDLEFAELGAELAISPGFAIDKTVWAGTERGLWRSRNAGDTWERLKSDAFSEEGCVVMIALSPVGLPEQDILITVKDEGMFQSSDDGATFHPFGDALVAENPPFKRLWSDSPGGTLKFAPIGNGRAELFAMGGESFFRLAPGEIHELPLRQAMRHVGTVDMKNWWGAVISLIVAGIGATGVLTTIFLRVRRQIAKRRV